MHFSVFIYELLSQRQVDEKWESLFGFRRVQCVALIDEVIEMFATLFHNPMRCDGVKWFAGCRMNIFQIIIGSLQENYPTRSSLARSLCDLIEIKFCSKFTILENLYAKKL